jgi:lysophospholipid acyltransferase (LPLAT)-like uncharacterized protein
MSLFKRFAASASGQTALGIVASWYLRLVWNTSRFIIEPADLYERVKPDFPVIVAMWHGQHFMAPFIKRPGHRIKVLISRHRDGEINAVAAERLGIGTVRGSGSHNGDFHRKGGVGAFRAMLDTLAGGCSMALTADVPKISRVAGLGIVKLAQTSGRPIYPAAVATSRRKDLKNWDRSSINMPFSRGAIVVGTPIWVPRDADDAALEVVRQSVEVALNAVTERAYVIVDRIVDRKSEINHG